MAVNVQNIKLRARLKGDTTYLEVGCLDSIGDIDFGSRNINEKSCMDSDTVRKVVGSLKLGNMALTYAFEPSEPAGHGVIKNAFDTSPAPTLEVQIELNDSAGTNGTSFEFEAVVSTFKLGIPKDDEVTVNTTLEMTTRPTVTAAA